jgi:hypothetical protein
VSVPATLVKELRDQTGAGMMDAKRALEESGGDLDAAKRLLRERGMAQAAKRAGRETSEGIVLVTVSGHVGSVVAVGCETEPVSKNAEFLAFAEQALETMQVKLFGLEAKEVARPLRSQDAERVAVLALRLEELAQVGDVALNGRLRSPRRSLGPELLDQTVGGDDPVRLEEKERQEGALLGASERKQNPVRRDRKRAEDLVLESRHARPSAA